MIKESKPSFKYLYNSEEFSDYNFHLSGKNINDKDISTLKDFNSFLTIYHRIPQKKVEKIFNKKITNEIKFLCVRAIIDSSIEDKTDTETIEYFGCLVYQLIKDFCIEYEYPEDRSEKYAKLCKDVYKHNISFYLNPDNK